MTPLRFEYEFRATVDDFWRVFFDTECMAAQYGQVGVREFAVEVSDDGPDRRVRTLRVTPARELPAVVRKLTGTTLGYLETTTFYKQHGYADTVVVPSTLAKRTAISGRHTVTASGPGHVTRVFEGTMTVDVKLTGARIEKAVLDDMTRSYRNGAEITQAWLDRLQ